MPANYNRPTPVPIYDYYHGLKNFVNDLIIVPDTQSAQSGARPETYGAVGDGIADDTNALLAAFATGLDVSLLKTATYLVRGELTLQNYRTLYGNGATIKRKAQVSSTTTTDVAPGTTQYVLASSVGFEVGMHVAFADSTVAQNALVAGTSLSDNNPKITAINGNTITLDTGPLVTFTATANVYSVSRGILLGVGSQILDLVIDGNKSNIAWNRWEVQNEIYQEGSRHRTTIARCYFHDIPGDCYQMRGNYNTIQDCVFENVNGNGIHMAAAVNPIVAKNRFINCNLNTTTIGHITGAITFSSTITYALILGNYVDNAYAGVGGINSNDSKHVVADNIIKNTTLFGIEGDGGATSVDIINNQLYDCGPVGATNGGIFVRSTAGPVAVLGNRLTNCNMNLVAASNVLASGNTLSNGRIILNTLSYSMVRDNILLHPTVTNAIDVSAGTSVAIQGNTIDLSGDTTLLAINVSSATDYTISGNTIIGGHGAISATSTAGLDVIIKDNKCYGQSDTGITAGSATGRFQVTGNAVYCTAASAGTWFGINITGLGVVCTRNLVNQVGGVASRGIRINAAAIVNGNTVLGTYSGFSIQINPASTSSSVTNNLIASNLSDLGTTTQLSNNTVIGAPSSSGGKALAVYASMGTISTSVNVDIAAADTIDITLGTAAPVLTLVNFNAGDGAELILRQDASGGRAPTFAHATLSVKWANNAVPTFSTLPNVYDIVAVRHTGTEISAVLVAKAYS